MVHQTPVTPIVVLDTETTGKDATVDEIVDIAAVRYINGAEDGVFSSLLNPGRPIPPESSAVHGIEDGDVIDAPTFADIREDLLTFIGDSVLVAHNASFDAGFLPDFARNVWICNLRFARHLWPGAPNHQNQTLRYWLRIHLASRERHRALADARVTAAVFFRGVDQYTALGHPRTIGALKRFVDAPILYPRLPFGKHRNQELDLVPDSYLRWALETVTDADIRHTLEREAQRRRDRAA